MSPSANTWSGSTSSITTLAVFPSISSYLKQTDLDNAINSLFAKRNDKFPKQDENMNALFEKHDAQIDKKIEKQLQPMLFQITYISSKQSEPRWEYEQQQQN